MFTNSGCLTTLLPLSSPLCLPLTLHSPFGPTHTQTHECSCRLSVATLLLPLSNFCLSSHLLRTHAYIHMHAHTHMYALACAFFPVLLAASRPQTWSHTSGVDIKDWRRVHCGGGLLNTTRWPPLILSHLKRDWSLGHKQHMHEFTIHMTHEWWNEVQLDFSFLPYAAFVVLSLVVSLWRGRRWQPRVTSLQVNQIDKLSTFCFTHQLHSPPLISSTSCTRLSPLSAYSFTRQRPSHKWNVTLTKSDQAAHIKMQLKTVSEWMFAEEDVMFDKVKQI